MPVVHALWAGESGGEFVAPDLTEVAARAAAATVHVGAKVTDDLGRPGQVSGSGTLLSEDGYIVTNNHVVAGAEKVNVTLSNGKELDASVVGADATTDVAVLKVDARNLPFLPYANSNEVKIGEWVLAAGYPFSLGATVTAGIVSAKARLSAMTYIQTDAAINHGNSGGPLVNREGELIGIIVTFASGTDAYVGYSFAIPANTVKKVVNEIMQPGHRQAKS